MLLPLTFCLAAALSTVTAAPHPPFTDGPNSQMLPDPHGTMLLEKVTASELPASGPVVIHYAHTKRQEQQEPQSVELLEERLNRLNQEWIGVYNRPSSRRKLPAGIVEEFKGLTCRIETMHAKQGNNTEAAERRRNLLVFEPDVPESLEALERRFSALQALWAGVEGERMQADVADQVKGLKCRIDHINANQGNTKAPERRSNLRVSQSDTAESLKALEERLFALHTLWAGKDRQSMPAEVVDQVKGLECRRDRILAKQDNTKVVGQRSSLSVFGPDAPEILGALLTQLSELQKRWWGRELSASALEQYNGLLCRIGHIWDESGHMKKRALPGSFDDGINCTKPCVPVDPNHDPFQVEADWTQFVAPGVLPPSDNPFNRADGIHPVEMPPTNHRSTNTDPALHRRAEPEADDSGFSPEAITSWEKVDAVRKQIVSVLDNGDPYGKSEEFLKLAWKLGELQQNHDILMRELCKIDKMNTSMNWVGYACNQLSVGNHLIGVGGY